MCIIIHRPAGVTLDPIIYENSFNRNDHGAGFAYVDDGKLVIEKGIFKLKQFLKKLSAHDGKEMIIHCRLMSKGKIGIENCHPFRAESTKFPGHHFAIVHNGTLPWNSTDAKSDTAHFVEEAIQPIVDRDPWFFNVAINRKMMSALIGSDNKVAIMSIAPDDKEGSVHIINKSKGIEYGGCWFSNLSFTDEGSRFVCTIDHDRIKNWKPKLYVEPVYHGTTTPSLPWPNDDEYGDGLPYYGGRRNINPPAKIPPKAEIVPPRDWVFVKGFGYYNKNPNYQGERSLDAFNKWMDKQAAAKPNSTEKKDGPPPDLGNVDLMEYLSATDFALARKECHKIIKEYYPDFDVKGMSTQELAAWVRAELRATFPEFDSMTNASLMDLVIHGKLVLATST